VVVGIHSPEYEWERERDAVIEHVKKHGLDYPHLLDNDHAYWDALQNEYWPALHLIDRCGRRRGTVVGEVHPGEDRTRQLEAKIEELLKESPEGCSS
jgi:hypothetical protein